jgi:hypothetical protein
MTQPNLYAEPQSVTTLADCYFYHTMEVPGYGLVAGEWDLRPGISDYLGHVDFSGKRVLEIGTANGHVCFHIESLGGNVVAVDLSERETWDIVPYAAVDSPAIVAQRRAHARRINNTFWGFGGAVVTQHRQCIGNERVPLFTVVARRHAPLPAHVT